MPYRPRLAARLTRAHALTSVGDDTLGGAIVRRESASGANEQNGGDDDVGGVAVTDFSTIASHYRHTSTAQQSAAEAQAGPDGQVHLSICRLYLLARIP